MYNKIKHRSSLNTANSEIIEMYIFFNAKNISQFALIKPFKFVISVVMFVKKKFNQINMILHFCWKSRISK